MQHPATPCNTVQHPATPCNTTFPTSNAYPPPHPTRPASHTSHRCSASCSSFFAAAAADRMPASSAATLDSSVDGQQCEV
eukprot:32492-Chlamydomonas_euryale.AAC.3